MQDILQYLPVKRKQSASGWISFDAPCCTHNGESQDRRGRGGIKISDQGWSYHCFNCQYTASFVLGRHLGFKAKRLLQWLGVPQEDIERINLESLRRRGIEGIVTDRQKLNNELNDIRFEERELRDGGIEFVTKEHRAHWQYLRSRCVPEDYPILLQPNDGAKSVIIPFTYDNRIVGSCTAFVDRKKTSKLPKYINDTQPGYVFGVDLQKSEWQYAIVVEGVFDALSINALAVLHNEVNDKQAKLINGLEKQIIVVPDQDRAGLKLFDIATENNWSVSVPPWPEDVKDVNDSVQRYGRLATVLSILENAVRGRIRIEMAKKKLQSRLGAN